jgi:hypothetical protein
VSWHNDVVAWATNTNIRVIHFSKRQKICLIEKPKPSASFPDYLNTASTSKPTMIWRVDKTGGGDFFTVSWCNLIKLCRLKTKDDMKFQMEVLRK